MGPIQAGFLSVIPPLVAIILALITKEVISSLLIGILSGAFIYSFSTGGGVIGAIDVTFNLMAQKIGEHAFILIFLALLGALVVVITQAGGSRAYGNWAAKKIKSRALAQISTFVLGVAVAIDDYFNCLTVGAVMKPITDRNKISRVKLAYLIDATAAPVCIIAPISSWAASVISYMDASGLNGMATFVKTIPYNLYALLTILMLNLIAFKGLDFGSMARFEADTIKRSNVIRMQLSADERDIADKDVSQKGTVYDLAIPIISLIVVSILMMLYTGGYFEPGTSLVRALSKTNSPLSITYGAFVSLVVSFVMFVPRRLLSFKQFMDGIMQGVKSMVSSFVILALAWTISAVCRELLCTGEYVGALFVSSSIPAILIPCIVFLLSGFLSFAMGTSWGTFGILIPIVAMVCEKVAPELTVIALSATLAGSVFGDHCSPISDTTILSSTGAGCNHIDHVSTQIPYASLVALVSFIGYAIAGATKSVFITLSVSVLLLVGALFVLNRRFKKGKAL